MFTITPQMLYPHAISSLKEMIAELIETLENENCNDLELVQCLFHNVSVQAKYAEEIAKDIDASEYNLLGV